MTFSSNNTVQANVTADTNIPDISTTGGTLTCTDLMVELSGGSTVADVTYSWTGLP